VRPGRTREEFRPGQRLQDVMVPMHFAHETQHDFGLSAQADRMLLSRCHTESGGRLECLTCHDPHVSVYSAERPADFFRRACLGCHAEADCPAPAAARQRTVPADDCVACHMRRAEPDDQRHTAFTDHWIRRDIEIERDPRVQFEVEPVFPDQVAQLSPGEQAYFAGRGNFLLAYNIPPASQGPLWARAESAFEEAIGAGFDGADSWFFLGRTRLSRGRRPQAIEAFEKALAHEPDHYDAKFALAQTLAATGQVDRAAGIFEQMLQEDPRNPMALSEAGRIWLARGRGAQTLAAFQTAVREEPWSATLQLNLGKTLASLGRFDEAARAGERAVALDPDDPDTWDFYANVMQVAGRPADAAEGRRQLALVRQRKAAQPDAHAGSMQGSMSE
jgi:cytochrome c-type biogenesis protein CcmH/NrfG